MKLPSNANGAVKIDRMLVGPSAASRQVPKIA